MQINDPNRYQKRIFTIPNLLSLLRICLLPYFLWLYLDQKDFLGAGVVLIASGITDILDGYIARTFHMISDLGKILDPIADKLTQVALLICLLDRYPISGILLVIVLAKEIYMSIAGSLVIRRTGKVPMAKWHGKAATVCLDVTMIALVFWQRIPQELAATLLVGCSFMVILSFILYAREYRLILAHARAHEN